MYRNNSYIKSISIDKEKNLFGITFKEHICCNWCKRIIPEYTLYYKLSDALIKFYENLENKIGDN